MISNEQLLGFLKKNVICVSALGIAVVFGVTVYLRSDIGPEEESILSQRSTEGARLEANIENSAQLKEQFAAITASNAAIQARMIHVGQLAENLRYFYKLESDTGTKLGELREVTPAVAGKNAPKTTYTPVGFAVTVLGEYPALIDFLRRLESGVHYVRVNQCSLTPVDAAIRGGPLTMSLNIELLGMP